jgi:hypothetical protein
MVDYVRMQATALRLIEANGRVVTLQRLSNTPADAAKPWNGPSTPTVAEEQEVTAAFVPHAGNIEMAKDLIDADLLKRCDQIALVGVSGTQDFKDFNQLVDDGVTYKIPFMRVLQPGTETLLYVFGIKS